MRSVSAKPLSRATTSIESPEDLVDYALAALDQGELVTLPSLPDASHWEALNAARLALGPNLSHKKPAARYKLAA